jgi:hypothetical protein
LVSSVSSDSEVLCSGNTLDDALTPFGAKWLSSQTQLQKGWLNPHIDVIFTRQEEFFQGIRRPYATYGQVANAGETPSSGKVQDSGPLFESVALYGIVVSISTSINTRLLSSRTYVLRI